MSLWKVSLSSSVVLAGLTSGTLAADVPPQTTKAPASVATCADPVVFVTTECPLTYWGITVYGAIDMGVGWEQHGAPLNRDIITGVEELIQKNSNRSLWLATPNGLTQSYIGIKVKEEFAPDWFFVSDWSFGFDPYTLSAANGPHSYLDNNGLPLALQSSNADSSRAGQWYNGTAYAGVSNSTFGTLTFGRQNSLTLDGVIEYDPMGAAYAFSVIGWSGLTAGAGDTEDARVTTAVKYRNNIGSLRVAGFSQLGGYDFNNGAQAVYEGQLGYDFNFGSYGRLSLDSILTYDKGAVASSPLSPAATLLYPGTIGATISDDSSLMLLGKWVNGPFKISGGYEIIDFNNPLDPQKLSFTDIAGIPVVASNINNAAYNNTRVQQVLWTGGRYAFTNALDAGVAYYHYYQDSYAKIACRNNSFGACAGALDAVSFDVDWQFAKKFDAYAGMLFSEVSNGLSSGYLHNENFAPTAGLRFRF